MFEYLAELFRLKEGEFVQDLNKIALATSAGQGGKEAVKQIKKLGQRHHHQERSKNTAPIVSIPLSEDIHV